MTIHQGTVTAFDAVVGLGEVEDHGGVRHGFHCTAIADGSRLIDVGTPVAYTIEPAGPGVWEARSVMPLTHHGSG